LRRAWLAAALGGSLLVGCERAAVKQNYPPDVLFANRRPVERKPEAVTPLVAHTEPAAPPLPQTALATAPRQRLVGVKTSTVKSNDSQNPPKQPPPAANPPEERARGIPAEAPGQGLVSPAAAAEKAADAPNAPPPAVPAPRPHVEGTYGHAPDYAWLQGVLDRHYRGHLGLRYCDHAEEDEWGGKVWLEPDPRLEQFKEGDIVFVKGEIAVEDGKPKRGAWNHYPCYRVRSVEPVQHQE
jgi:hypothetical protein